MPSRRGRKKSQNRVRLEELAVAPIGATAFFTNDEMVGKSSIHGVCAHIGGASWVKTQRTHEGMLVTKVEQPDRTKTSQRGTKRSETRIAFDALYAGPVGGHLLLPQEWGSTRIHTWLNRCGGLDWARVDRDGAGWRVTKVAA